MEVNKFYNTFAFGLFGFLLIVFVFIEKPKVENKVKYFTTKEVNASDTYFGTKIDDPFRWLEDDYAKETKNWVYKQNQITSQYLARIPFRTKLKNKIRTMLDYTRTSTPFKKHNNYYYYYNDGKQNHSVLYKSSCLDCKGVEMINPNKWSADGTVALRGTHFSNNGKYLGFGRSSSGSDWKEFLIMDLETGEVIDDKLKWIKFSGMSWRGNGFYYSKYPELDEKNKFSSKNSPPKIYYHSVNTSQDQDLLIYENTEDSLASPYIGVTDDEKYLVLYQSKGTHGNTLSIKHIDDQAFTIINNNFDSDISVVHNLENKFFLITNENASNKKVVLVDVDNPSIRNWKTIIPESDHVIQSVSFVGNSIVVKYLIDVAADVHIYNYNGDRIDTIKLPGLGSAWGFTGDPNHMETFYSYSSYNMPSTIYRYDFTINKSFIYKKSNISFDSSKYITKREFCLSKDGTKIPVFITHQKNLVLNGSNPTLLGAYGGFNISMTPGFSSSSIVLLENGGVYARACLRGGGEYGEKWHRDGMLDKKQNVFDDFIAASEYLINQGYTSPKFLAIQGGSNGGLLVGAVVNQRPDLYRVAFPAVGVLDMLRYHKFTIGWAWAVEYGSSKYPDQFETLLAYSPLHNINPYKQYPAIMVTTGDHDDRVVPAHSFKYIAQLQKEKKNNILPLLIRVETNAGHGAGKPISKIIQERADMWSFMFYNMEINPY